MIQHCVYTQKNLLYLTNREIITFKDGSFCRGIPPPPQTFNHCMELHKLQRIRVYILYTLYPPIQNFNWLLPQYSSTYFSRSYFAFIFSLIFLHFIKYELKFFLIYPNFLYKCFLFPYYSGGVRGGGVFSNAVYNIPLPSTGVGERGISSVSFRGKKLISEQINCAKKLEKKENWSWKAEIYTKREKIKARNVRED
jgi:hypothetical protein